AAPRLLVEPASRRHRPRADSAEAVLRDMTKLPLISAPHDLCASRASCQAGLCTGADAPEPPRQADPDAWHRVCPCSDEPRLRSDSTSHHCTVAPDQFRTGGCRFDRKEPG